MSIFRRKEDAATSLALTNALQDRVNRITAEVEALMLLNGIIVQEDQDIVALIEAKVRAKGGHGNSQST